MNLKRFIFEDNPQDEKLKKDIRNFLRAVPLCLYMVVGGALSIIKEDVQNFLEDIAGEISAATHDE